ncbi:MAG: methionyl-tRNA formyltransferase [Gemmatimonadaceae bacterium]
MRIVFFGIYEIGLRALEAMHAGGLPIAAVVTKPDIEFEKQPVASVAARMALPTLQPGSPKNPEFLGVMRELAPDLIVVAGYHRIIPAELLRLPARGTINLHGSMLPKYRGPCTWKWAIMNGETTTGVSVHYMKRELDAGDVLAQRPIVIAPDDTGGTLFSKISVAGASLLVETILAMARGDVQARAQDEREASYFGYPSDEEARINWTAPSPRIANLVRGLLPSPRAWSRLAGNRVEFHGIADLGFVSSAPPGTIVAQSSTGLDVATGSNVVRLLLGDGVIAKAVAVGARFETEDGAVDRSVTPA